MVFYSFVVCLLELPLNLEKLTDCYTVSCTMQKYRAVPQNFMKLAICFLNVLCAVYFLYKYRQVKFKILKNRAVKVTMLLELLLVGLPLFSSQAFNLIFGVSPVTLIGQFTIALGSINELICSIYYFRIFLMNSTWIQPVK
uniref:Uncharacterized protein n=1 Tax=Ditylenchus dipsaci TaxID=166011 RepID=A0A915EI63_9BILA